jgi:hypothetical protein
MRLPSASSPLLAIVAALITAAVAQAACGSAPDPRRTQFQVERGGVRAEYDRTTGRLRMLTLDTNRDGRPDTWSWMHGARTERIALDTDADGTADRWEYFDDDGTLLKVGMSGARNGTPDTWIYRGPGEQVNRIDRATTRPETVDRVEYYEQGGLTRVATDTNRDGQWDMWELFERPLRPGDEPLLRAIELDLEHGGRPTQRLLYHADGSFDRSEYVHPVAGAPLRASPAAATAGRPPAQTP